MTNPWQSGSYERSVFKVFKFRELSETRNLMLVRRLFSILRFWYSETSKVNWEIFRCLCLEACTGEVFLFLTELRHFCTMNIINIWSGKPEQSISSSLIEKTFVNRRRAHIQVAALVPACSYVPIVSGVCEAMDKFDKLKQFIRIQDDVLRFNQYDLSQPWRRSKMYLIYVSRGHVEARDGNKANRNTYWWLPWCHCVMNSRVTCRIWMTANEESGFVNSSAILFVFQREYKSGWNYI